MSSVTRLASSISLRTTLSIHWRITEIELAWHMTAYVSGSWLDSELSWHHTWLDNLHQQDKSAPDVTLAAAGWWPFTSCCDWLRRRERMCGYFWATMNPSPRSETAARRHAAKDHLCLPRWLTAVNLSVSALRVRLTTVRMCQMLQSFLSEFILTGKNNNIYVLALQTLSLVPFYNFTFSRCSLCPQ